MKKGLLLITTVLVLISCIDDTTVNTVIYKRNMNDGIENVIKECIDKNKGTHAFLLLTDYCFDDNISSCHRKLIIGPAYKGLFCNGEGSYNTYPSSCVCIKDKYIFVHSSVDVLYKNKEMKSFYEKKSMMLKSAHSYSLCMTAFLSKAILFEVDVCKGDVKIISQSPDTIFIKDRIEYIPPYPVFEIIQSERQ